MEFNNFEKVYYDGRCKRLNHDCTVHCRLSRTHRTQPQPIRSGYRHATHGLRTQIAPLITSMVAVKQNEAARVAARPWRPSQSFSTTSGHVRGGVCGDCGHVRGAALRARRLCVQQRDGFGGGSCSCCTSNSSCMSSGI